MWLTSDFLEDVKLRGFLPNVSNLTDSEILRIADSQIRTRIVPLIKRAEQEFWLAKEDYTLVANTYAYRIPSATILGELRKVVIVDVNGIEYDIVRTTFDRLSSYSRYSKTGWWRFLAYALKGDMVTLTALPDLNSGPWTLRMYYYQRPPRLVLTSQCAQLIPGSFNDQGTTFGAPGTGWVIGDTLELRQPDPNFGVLATVEYVTNGGSYFEWLPGLYAPCGDPTPFNYAWMCVAGTSCVVAIPDMTYDLLVDATVYQVLMTLGFMEQAGAFKVDLVEREAQIREILEPRVRAPAEKVINRGSYLRRGW